PRALGTYPVPDCPDRPGRLHPDQRRSIRTLTKPTQTPPRTREPPTRSNSSGQNARLVRRRQEVATEDRHRAIKSTPRQGVRNRVEVSVRGGSALTWMPREWKAVQSAASGSIQRARVSRSADNWSRRLVSSAGRASCGLNRAGLVGVSGVLCVLTGVGGVARRATGRGRWLGPLAR